MYHVSRHFAAAAVIGLCMIPATAARAEDQDRNDKANRYVITNLDSDLKGAAAVQDTVRPAVVASFAQGDGDNDGDDGGN
jgi:hypothetical protein